MIQAGSGLRLAAEAAEQMLIGGDVIGKKFESNETAETGVLGLINHSHSAAAELFDHLVMRDGLADHVRLGESLAAILGRMGEEVNAETTTCSTRRVGLNPSSGIGSPILLPCLLV